MELFSDTDMVNGTDCRVTMTAQLSAGIVASGTAPGDTSTAG
jgi:hypothetical protein